jgi:hypothetical protein
LTIGELAISRKETPAVASDADSVEFDVFACIDQRMMLPVRTERSLLLDNLSMQICIVTEAASTNESPKTDSGPAYVH